MFGPRDCHAEWVESYRIMCSIAPRDRDGYQEEFPLVVINRFLGQTVAKANELECLLLGLDRKEFYEAMRWQKYATSRKNDVVSITGACHSTKQMSRKFYFLNAKERQILANFVQVFQVSFIQLL